MASALTLKLPSAMACFMASTFSALNTSLPPPLDRACEADDDRVTVTPAWGWAAAAAAPPAAAASAPAFGFSAAFWGPPATEPI
jgi:hypothetical protein